MTRRSKITRAKRVRIFDAAGGICHLCGHPIDGTKEDWEVEHPIALGMGGSDKESELRPAHVHCHKDKTAKDKKVIAKTVRARAAHIGARSAPRKKLEGAGFAKTEKLRKPPLYPNLPRPRLMQEE